METLDQSNHQIIFSNIGTYATDVQFHHIHIPVQLGHLVQITKTAKQMITNYTENIYKETLMHYHNDNLYPDPKQATAYAQLLTAQNQYVTNSS